MGMSPARRLLTAATALVVSAGLVGAAAVDRHDVVSPKASVTAAAKPNIVLILTDDLDALTSPYWDAMPKTAALLRDTGMTFTNSFGPTPTCCPARSTILTGKYAHNTGVYNNGGTLGGFKTFLDNGNETRTLATYLKGAGYRTGIAGKYLNGIQKFPTHIAPGWDEWSVGIDSGLYTGYNYTLNENGKMVLYGAAPTDYETDVVARKGVSFINRATAANQPFFWYAASTAPHRPIVPAPRHATTWANAVPPQRPNFQEQDVSDKPTWLIDSAAARSANVVKTNTVDYRNRMGSLMAVDDMTAKLVGAVKAAGQLGNTYFIWTSDNGYNLGAHRLTQKFVPYEESLQVPMVISGPGVVHGTDDHMVIQPDIMPTILDMAGIPEPADVDGVSLRPLLTGTTPARWRTDFVGQYGGGGANGAGGVATELAKGESLTGWIDVPSWSGVRDQRYVYIRWYERERPESQWEYELYDLQTDPYQLTNLVKTPAGKLRYQVITGFLDARLRTLLACTGVSCRP